MQVEGKRWEDEEFIAIPCKYAIYKRDKKGKLRLHRITHERTPCRCNCCTIGGVSYNVPQKVNSAKNCSQYKSVMKLEKEIEERKKGHITHIKE